MHAQKMQLGKKKNLVHIQSWDQVEVFVVLTGLIFEVLFKIMQSWVLHLELWRVGRLVLQGMFPWKGEGWKSHGIVNAA